MLTFESSSVLGVTGIVEKLVVSQQYLRCFGQLADHIHTNFTVSHQGLPFQKVKHQVSTLDAQPSNEAGGITILVTGQLLVRLSQSIVSGGRA